MAQVKRKSHSFGILEDKHYPDGSVPGTVLLEDDTTHVDLDQGLKHATGRNSHIILQPQPSDDPRDPLNWPTAKKEAVFWTLVFTAGLVGATGPLLAPGYAVLAEEWKIDINAVAAVNGDLVIALGVIMTFISPFAVKFGRRPVYIIASLVLFLSSIWAGASQSFESFKWARIFNGLGMAAFEALVVSSIGDIYFTHERGFRSAIWGFSILAGINVTPIINGYLIASRLGYRYCFWFISIFYGFAFISIVLFCPETMYHRLRDSEANLGVGHVLSTDLDTDSSKANGETEHIEKRETGVSRQQEYLPARTFVQELAPVTYRGKENFFMLVLRPFPFFLSPAVWFGIFSYGLTTCWLVVLSVSSSVIFASPPYLFDSTQTGLVSIGPLVASIPSTLIAGPLVDWVASYMAKKNAGVFEPEFRLFLMIPMLLLEVFGFMGWSLMVRNGTIPWIGPVFMYSFINAGQAIGSAAIVTYLVDVHRKHSAECFAVLNLTKNLVLFGFTQFVVNWVVGMGVAPTLGILAGVSAICIGTALPMYIFGKRVRSFVARHEKLYMSVEQK